MSKTDWYKKQQLKEMKKFKRDIHKAMRAFEMQYIFLGLNKDLQKPEKSKNR